MAACHNVDANDLTAPHVQYHQLTVQRHLHVVISWESWYTFQGLPETALPQHLQSEVLTHAIQLRQRTWVENVRHHLGLGYGSTGPMSLLDSAISFYRRPQWPICAVWKWFSRDHCCRGMSKLGCWIVASATKWLNIEPPIGLRL